MVKTIGSICIVIGCIALFVACIPWLSCASSYPVNAVQIVQQFPSVNVPLEPSGAFSEAASVCWDAYPVSHERLPLIIGFITLLIGMFARFFGSGYREELRVPEHIAEQQRRTSAQRPIETKRHDLSESEIKDGIEIDVDLEELGLGASEPGEKKAIEEEEPTLMDQVVQTVKEIERKEHEELDAKATIDGFYCPPNMAERPILYVDPDHEGASDTEDDERGESVEKPFRTIAAAIFRAKHVSRLQGTPVQVRLAPGVYQEAVEIPTNIMLVNHRMPAEGELADRVKWLMNQDELDVGDRVTILAPVDVDAAVTFEPGTSQGIFGIHIVSREKTDQQGILAKRSDGVTVVNCLVDGFRHGGAEVDLCGGDLAMGGVQFLGCCFLNNRAQYGGAIRASQSALNFEDCLFMGNQARSGGAIHATRLRAPLQLTRCEFRENRAQCKEIPELEPELIEPLDWEKIDGLGGAIWAIDAQLKIHQNQFRDNGASVSGGTLAMLSCKAILAGADDDPMVIRRARARSGGGIFASSPFSKGGTIRAKNVHIEHCLGKYGGGGAMLIGKVTMQMEKCRFEFNKADEVEGIGGGLALCAGSELIGAALIFRSNHAGEGAGVMVRNASIRLKDHSIFQDNEAHFAAGAGILVDTIRQPLIERVVAQNLMKLPFVVKMLDVEFVGNISTEAPCSVGIGDFADDPVLSIGVELGRSIDFRSNRVHGQKEPLDGDDFLIQWRGEPKMTERSLRVGKFLLG